MGRPGSGLGIPFPSGIEPTKYYGGISSKTSHTNGVLRGECKQGSLSKDLQSWHPTAFGNRQITLPHRSSPPTATRPGDSRVFCPIQVLLRGTMTGARERRVGRGQYRIKYGKFLL